MSEIDIMKTFFKEGELEKIKEGITAELKPYLDSIMKMDKKSAGYRQFSRALDSFNQRLHRGIHIYDYVMKEYGKFSKYNTKEEIHRLFAYLGLVESIGNTVTDIIVMSLVANGIDFHVESVYSAPRIRHVIAIEDLEKYRVPLATKLEFLRDNGVTVFPSVVDSKLRNAIAHMKLEVRNKQIYINRKPSSEIVLPAWYKLFTAITTVQDVVRLVQDENEFFEA